MEYFISKFWIAPNSQQLGFAGGLFALIGDPFEFPATDLNIHEPSGTGISFDIKPCFGIKNLGAIFDRSFPRVVTIWFVLCHSE